MSNWQAMADAYMAENPNVTINITVMENEAYKAALQTNVQAGDVPDLFQSWGGGVLRDQVEAGVVQDITEASAEYLDALSPGAAGLFNIDGVQYGLPYNQSIVGMWYNKDLFGRGRPRSRRHRRRGPSCWRPSSRSRTPASRRSPSAPATSGRHTSGTRT